jgi:DNA-binding response OmpR family regulator
MGQSPSSSPGPGPRAPRLLIIEDHEDTRKVWTLFLQRRGYVVETASDGKQGMDMATASLPDLILLDLMLPNRSGVQIARELKRRADTRAIPIIVVTGWPLAVAHLPGLAGYILKPCLPDAVVAAVQRALEGRALAAARETAVD